MVRRILGLCLILIGLLLGGEAQAGVLAERLAQFPDWESKPAVTVAEGDLVYPAWMEGTWSVTSTLTEQIAPLAPEVVTPGFESNRRYLNQPVRFQVRFQKVNPSLSAIRDRFLSVPTQNLKRGRESSVVVADREFNGLNIAKAYLGDRAVRSVKVDPDSPNRQITALRSERQLISVVTARGAEIPKSDRFIATEITHQFFRGTPQPYFNEVETTTSYQFLPSPRSIEAWQVTAVYLSPQDPNYFKALERPVALYRYRLELEPIKYTD
ncbi:MULTISPECIES: DUF6816 family protein [unclassified Coleofasciculus]|uniref:DUF6816 family protein n=1 Tax=unclassified Coleofasciculus TaxID=2692782 RepID=UPI00188248DB|nr:MULTISPECIES: hypothetical protein [unclassified Coleofasciculus]MBE9129627.1 hypothetical protein [Coleofasciculus sp. LEGE 07081]MBE9149801.1 hypothetical protein [Coleofasciculus sp. LEGE 07092]